MKRAALVLLLCAPAFAQYFPPGGVAGAGLCPNGAANAVQTTDGTNCVGVTALPNGTTATTQSTGDATTKLSNDLFVSNAIAAVTPYGAVQAGTTAVLSNTPTYSNGSAGVGATLTAGSVGALTVDGYVVLLNDRILVKNQASALQNGVYTQTTLGTGGVTYVLTRAADYNSPTNINYTGDIFLLNGSTLSGQSWVLQTQITAVGTSSLTFIQDTTPSGQPGNGNVKAQGTLCAKAIITGVGGKSIQAPNCNSQLDSSGNVTIGGAVSTGVSSGLAGVDAMQGGTQTLVAPIPSNSTGWIGPTSVTGQHFYQVPGTAAAAHQVFLLGAESAGIAIMAMKTIPDCQDTAGQHLNFTQSTDTFTCGSSSAGGASTNQILTTPQVTAVVTANWSNLGASCTRAVVTGPTGGGALNVISNTGTTNVCGYSRTVAAGDFSQTFIIWGGFANSGNGGYQMGFTDGAKTESCSIINSAGVSLMTFIQDTVLSGGSISGANGVVGGNQVINPQGPQFIKLSRTGTALTCSYSNDGGITYVVGFTDTVPFLTASSVYFAADPRSAAASNPSYATLISSTLP